MQLDGLLTQHAAAIRAGVTTRTIRNWVRTGRLVPAWQVDTPKGLKLFHPEDVDRAAGNADSDIEAAS